jgi:hypothetical protein
MSKTNDSLNETFDITPTEVVAEVPAVKPSGKLSRKDKSLLVSEAKEEDASYVRGKLYQMSEMLSQAAAESLDVAVEHQHPRAYEVTGNLMKQCAEVAEMLLTVQEKNKKLQEEEVKIQATQNNTTNNVFVGSTKDLLLALKEAG